MPSNKDLIYLQFQSLLQFHNAAMHRKGNGSQCTVHCALHRFTMVGNAHFSAQLTSKSGGAVTQQNAHRFIFRSLEPILMSNTGKKSEKETLRKQHQCRRFRTDTGKLLQIQSLQATARMLVSTYSCVASNLHGVHVKNVHKCSHKNWDRNVHQKNVHTARILLLTFAACRCRFGPNLRGHNW